MLYDNGWFRVAKMNRRGRQNAHYFFNDEPIHVLKTGCFKEKIDHTKRYSNNGKKCKTCLILLQTYSKIGLENRCV